MRQPADKTEGGSGWRLVEAATFLKLGSGRPPGQTVNFMVTSKLAGDLPPTGATRPHGPHPQL